MYISHSVTQISKTKEPATKMRTIDLYVKYHRTAGIFKIWDNTLVSDTKKKTEEAVKGLWLGWVCVWKLDREYTHTECEELCGPGGFVCTVQLPSTRKNWVSDKAYVRDYVIAPALRRLTRLLPIVPPPNWLCTPSVRKESKK